MIKAVFKDKHENLVFLKKVIFIFIWISFFLLIFKIVNQLVLRIIELVNQKFSTLEIIIDIFLTVSTMAVATLTVALIGLFFTLSNYLRKHGNHVEAVLGQEFGSKRLILVNKKDKPLVFNSMCLLVDNDKYLELFKDEQKTLKTVSQYEVVKPYEALSITLRNSPLLDDLLLNRSEYAMRIALLTDEGITICKGLDIIPIQVRALRDSKNFKILNPNIRLDI